MRAEEIYSPIGCMYLYGQVKNNIESHATMRTRSAPSSGAHHNDSEAMDVTLDPPEGTGTPLKVQTAHLPPDTPATRLDRLDEVVLTLRLGASTRQTAPTLADLLDDALIAAICTAWGIHTPPAQIRADPIGALGPLAGLIIIPGIIPPQLAHHRE